jgi:hypothetical protein
MESLLFYDFYDLKVPRENDISEVAKKFKLYSKLHVNEGYVYTS